MNDVVREYVEALRQERSNNEHVEAIMTFMPSIYIGTDEKHLQAMAEAIDAHAESRKRLLRAWHALATS